MTKYYNIFKYRSFINLLHTISKGNKPSRALVPISQRAYSINPYKVVTVLALFWPLKNDSKPEPEQPKNNQLKKLLTEADSLFDNEQYQDCLQFIKNICEIYQKDVEVLWRKSRVLYQLANQPDIDEKLKKDLANEAYSTITVALAVNDKHFAVHKWMSVILDLKSSCESLSERIKNLENVKKHMLHAIEINPHDATTLYMLGEWCYRLAEMPWYQRRIAQTLFATPPTSTFEEAIQYFSKAEVAEPRFYSMNLLMLGKTYLKLGKQDIAKYYLNLALMYPARSNDDHQANKEAQDILKHLH